MQTILKESLVTQAANPVLWEDCVAEMVNFGVTRFVEVGPGKSSYRLY